MLVSFFLPSPPFSCYHLSCKCHSPSLLSLANSSSLYPFPEQLKGRTLIEIGEKQLSNMATGPMFLLSLISGSLCKETLPFCSGWRHCVLTQCLSLQQKGLYMLTVRAGERQSRKGWEAVSVWTAANSTSSWEQEQSMVSAALFLIHSSCSAGSVAYALL